MSQRPYQLWAALVVEVYRKALEKRPALGLIPGLGRFIEALMPHWLEWRTDRILQEVDQQAEAIADAWAAADQQALAPIITEAPPDGSQAQALLGGELRIRAPWVDCPDGFTAASPWVDREVGYDREAE